MTAEDTHDSDVLCGLGKFRPRWLQVFNNPKAMFVFMSIYGFTHGFVVSGVFNIDTSSFERRFHLSSYQVGWISAGNDVAAATIGTLISYYGAGRYKARWISLGIAFIGVGCMLLWLPHFLTGLYQWGQDDLRICRNDGDGCTFLDTGLTKYLGFLFAGHFMNGISGATFLTVGMSYIDDSFPSESSPLYTGLLHALLYVGVGFGFVLGGEALNLYVDFDHVPKENWIITPHDPRWVGAWWLSFMFAFVICVILGFVFLLYGSELPHAKAIRESHDKEYQYLTGQTDAGEQTPGLEEHYVADSHNLALIAPETRSYGAFIDNAGANVSEQPTDTGNDLRNNIDNKHQEKDQSNVHVEKKKDIVANNSNVADTAESKGVKHLFVTLIHILKSPTFVFLCLAYACSFMVLTACAVFFAKTVQFQYNQTPAMSAILAGLILIPGAGLGQFLGGFIIQKLGLQVRGSLIVAIITKGASVPLTIMFLFTCDKMDLAGWSAPYDNQLSFTRDASKAHFYTGCNSDCNCHVDLFDPVCDNNSKQYFSPCFAGCSNVVSSSDQIYSNCSCLLMGNSSSIVSADLCQYGCTEMYYVLATLFICLTLISCIFIPIQTVILRIHSDFDKTFSLGIMWMFARVLGAIPGPIILGSAIDATCVVWGKGCEEGMTSCWIYDNQLLGRNVCIFTTSVNFGACLLLTIAYLFYMASIRKKESYLIKNGKELTNVKE